MENITIRKATVADLPYLLQFEQGVIETERAFDPTLKEDTAYYYFKTMLDDSNICLLIALTNDGIPIGSGFARIENAPPYLKHDRYAYLAYMYVDPKFRRMGVNSQILDALIGWSRKQGIEEIRLKVYVKNSAALKAYEKAGFESHAVEMRRNYKERE